MHYVHDAELSIFTYMLPRVDVDFILYLRHKQDTAETTGEAKHKRKISTETPGARPHREKNNNNT